MLLVFRKVSRFFVEVCFLPCEIDLLANVSLRLSNYVSGAIRNLDILFEGLFVNPP